MLIVCVSHQGRGSLSREDSVEAAEVVAVTVEPPLAKLIAHMKNTASKIFLHDPQVNDFIRVTADNRSVNLLCR